MSKDDKPKPRMLRVQLSLVRQTFEIEIEPHADDAYMQRAVRAIAPQLLQASYGEVPYTEMGRPGVYKTDPAELDSMERASDEDLDKMAGDKIAVAREQTKLDQVYTERMVVVSMLTKLAQRLGYPCYIGNDEKAFGWPVVYIELPEGQVSWHIAEHDQHLFDHLELNVDSKWDGKFNGRDAAFAKAL